MALAFSALIAADAAVAVSSPLPPNDADARNRLGWARYRAGEFERAAEVFRDALARSEGDVDARTGLGYALLQLGRLGEAGEAFRRVLARDPAHDDAREGLGLTIARGGGPETRFRPDADPGLPLSVPARAIADYLEVRDPSGAYAPLFVKGVNLGAALPGKFPTEFPREIVTYLDWLDTMAGFGANVVRVYTLLPPEFYAALAAHNAAASSRKLWLVQGVWTELPPAYDFDDAEFVSELHDEIARAIDAVHGDLALPPRPGHASGFYDADASPWLLALVVGREWEPYAVKAFDAAHPKAAPFEGTWFRATGGAAMESWVASTCEFAAAYEARRYRTIRPLTFANWPTLDPLRHDSESNRDEEDAWKARYGVPFPEALRDEPWENDAVSLDATRIAPTAAMKAGFFAAYHVYPNYPDFLNQEPVYAAGRDRSGPSRYAAYLAELKRYHGHQPVLIAELGMSSSRGVAHVAPDGWDHGGHDERDQGERIVRLMDAVHDTGCAGGILFEFMDEWFKGTWSTSPVEIPAERRRLWWNAESPEESYGLIAQRPSSPIAIDGDPRDWSAAPLVASEHPRGEGWGALRALEARADEGFVYLLLRTGGGGTSGPWGKVAYRIAIDTYDPGRGETALPAPGAATIATGAEFLVELDGPGASRVTVTSPYEPYAAIGSGPIASPRGGAGSFSPLTMETNRERFGRDGTRYPAIRVERGALRVAPEGPDPGDLDTRTDVAVGAAAGTIELRLPWALLNVTDPSSRRVLHQEREHEPPLDTVVTPGFRFYAFAIDAEDPGRRPLSRLPARGKPPLFTWPTWEVPAYRTEEKRGVAAVRRGLGALPDRPETAGKGGVDAR